MTSLNVKKSTQIHLFQGVQNIAKYLVLLEAYGIVLLDRFSPPSQNGSLFLLPARGRSKVYSYNHFFWFWQPKNLTLVRPFWRKLVKNRANFWNLQERNCPFSHMLLKRMVSTYKTNFMFFWWTLCKSRGNTCQNKNW